MNRDLDRRLRRLEAHGGGGPPPAGVQVVVIAGGLPQAMSATLPETGEQLDAWDGEELQQFRRRAIEWAEDAGTDVVVITGVRRSRGWDNARPTPSNMYAVAEAG
jgi:hypothetical protein